MLLNKNKRVGKVNRSFKIKRFTQLQKIFFISILLFSLQFESVLVKAKEQDDFQTIYHIYSNDEYIGLLSDKNKLEQLKENIIEERNLQFEDFTLMIGNNLSIIPERVFSANINDESILETLENTLTVETEAVGIQVDDQVAFYVKDEASYESVIRKLKLQTVNEQELDEYETSNESNSSLPPLKENETRIVDIILSSELQPVSETVAPDEVLTVKEALKLLNKGTLEEKKYTVQSGDVLGKIASKHDMSVQKLLEINEDLREDSVIRVGDELNVTYTEPYVEVEVHYEAKNKLKIPYDKVTKKDDSLYKGDNKVTQQGKDGEKVVTELIRKKNGQVIGKSVTEEEIISEPVEEVIVRGTKVIPSRGTGTFKWPAVGGYVSSKMGMRWGRMHNGIDIARPSNRSILAADNGVVVSTGFDGSYGNKVVIDHKNGYRTLYAHLASIDVKPGQTVTAGSKIGVMGTTGRSTGIHLHFEVTKNGTRIDPLTVLR
ncbi:peptidoglycan DD-metalloendopeptidase family protein [Sporosarcina pasteurii]|uniref:Murein hydrolase activator NlpD n=1 Tax=Sporosarcina pasteurii TaxID=1474 RepID=A0A380CLR6_SPOPA|nr:M23 family metallopeptidase [Sporosarcina pasteurii]MDS9471853.1 M23 family metallopeptidase [Sporosarcina pasteurii]QBQ06592.1 M23 family metallopeptidase [Sporosarcina pasteurii]SUJ22011.1 Murein hydrolase activator NlpD precursor [Sporosarcina pasteurii]